jgi:hypothetical protein
MRKLKSWANIISLIGCLVTADHALAQATTPQPDIKLVEKMVLDGAVTVLIPESFSPMTEELLRLKYPRDGRPALAFANERGSVNLAMSLTGNAVRPEQIASLHKAVEATFKNLYPSATWYRSEIITQDGKTYFTLDLLTPAADTQIRNIMLGTSFRGRLLMLTFNVTRELEKDWLDTGRKMLSSIKLAE